MGSAVGEDDNFRMILAAGSLPAPRRARSAWDARSSDRGEAPKNRREGRIGGLGSQLASAPRCLARGVPLPDQEFAERMQIASQDGQRDIAFKTEFTAIATTL